MKNPVCAPDIDILIQKIRNAGVGLSTQDGNLCVEGGKLSDSQRQFIKNHKPEIMAYLLDNAFDAAEERAAIMEYDGGLSRQEAEQYAIETHLKPFHFTTTDGDGILLSTDLESARDRLEYQFSQKLLEIEGEL